MRYIVEYGDETPVTLGTSVFIIFVRFAAAAGEVSKLTEKRPNQVLWLNSIIK